MDAIREYLICVTAAALICGIATRIVKSGAVANVVKLMAGILMALVIVSPLLRIRLDQLMDALEDIQISAENIAAEGEKTARTDMEELIIQQLQSYILDKAGSMGVELTVEIELESQGLPIPCAVTLCGSVGPYAKSVLSEYIEENLGIKAEEQRWIT